MPDIEVELVDFILVYNYVMVAVRGQRGQQLSKILTERNRESGNNMTTQELEQMTVVKIKISLLLQNHQHSTIYLVMCNDHERHSGPHIPEHRNSQRIYQEITTKMGCTEKCYLLTYKVNTLSLFSFQCFCMYETTILQIFNVFQHNTVSL
jgi:hypothetical protein